MSALAAAGAPVVITPDVTGLRNLLADLGVSAYAARRRALT